MPPVPPTVATELLTWAAVLGGAGPQAILASVALGAVWMLRKERQANQELQDKILALISTQVEASTRHEGTLVALKDVLNQVLGRL